jgi:hypothetical protein
MCTEACWTWGTLQNPWVVNQHPFSNPNKPNHKSVFEVFASFPQRLSEESFRCLVILVYRNTIFFRTMWLKHVKTIMNYPFGNGLYHHIPPIYGDLEDGLLLFYPHYTKSTFWYAMPISPSTWLVSDCLLKGLQGLSSWNLRFCVLKQYSNVTV